ncbi:MAG: HlyD family type I secretion periplasmic adaptor subunit [Paracoccus sp. (in: a-proteobacteria)]|nr:HlyD family type I secretion periplasmic adaptor subunit [Paracoccus sp. (in: a-proteobacteria)]
MRHQPPPLTQSRAALPAHGVSRIVTQGLAALFFLVAGAGTWSVMARIDSAVVVQGAAELDERRRILQHAAGGTLTDMRVAEGDHVSAGQLLMRLDDTQIATERRITQARLAETKIRRARLEAEAAGAAQITLPEGTQPDDEIAAGQMALWTARRATTAQQEARLDEQHAQLAAQIDGLRASMTAVETERGLLAQELADQQSLLARGLTAAPRVRSLEADIAALDGRAGELQAQVAQAALRQSELALMRLEAEASRRLTAQAELRDMTHQETELAARLAALDDQLAGLTIRAPVDGVLYLLQPAGEGAVIRPAETIAVIVPQDRPLIFAARVPASEIDAVALGQEVTLRLNTARAGDGPELAGRVSRIAPAAELDETTRAPVYRVDVTADQLPPETRLLPGMQADLFIRTGLQSPIAYLLAPLSAHLSRAMREG